MLGVDAPSVIIFIKSLKAAMSKSFYHALIVNRQLSLVKLFFALVTLSGYGRKYAVRNRTGRGPIDRQAESATLGQSLDSELSALHSMLLMRSV